MLYLALEDGDRRLQDRCQHLLGRDVAIPEALHVLTRLADPRRLLDTLRVPRRAPPSAPRHRRHPDPHPPPAPANVQQYDHEYRVFALLKQVADEHGIALLVVHTRARWPRLTSSRRCPAPTA